jgi:hypothetical protein
LAASIHGDFIPVDGVGVSTYRAGVFMDRHDPEVFLFRGRFGAAAGLDG